MPTNGKRVQELLKEEIEKVEFRYNGYRDELKDLIADILVLEQENFISKTNIQQKMGDLFELAGKDLTAQQNQEDS